jgi:hypothetical protein
MLLSKKVTHNIPKVKVVIDNNRFSDLSYKFIYESPSNDTIKSYPLYAGNKHYRNILLQTMVSDTLNVEVSLDKEVGKPFEFEIYSGNNIKVLKTIADKTRTYFIDVNDNRNTHLINPRRKNKYKTEQVSYSVIASFSTEPNRVRRYRRFYNEIEESISYWFEDHPESISVYQREYSMKKFYRTNIVRY